MDTHDINLHGNQKWIKWRKKANQLRNLIEIMQEFIRLPDTKSEYYS